MAAGFSVRVYGTLDQQPPYVATNEGNLPAVQATYSSDATQVANLPSANINIWPIEPGVIMNGGTYCYGAIEIPASGLQLHSTKYVVQQGVAALATLRNA